ncbi:ribosomal protein S18-alanine N-acetyltransferase [Rhodococcus maanshanensis]|uniref:Ribosomal-protein-alanine N-acetyltransferase n=1 Tax=Rhodococcus maanshanensis TaxID=183556 RepID=A0A1H7KJG2_9NOCA|nr:ribosomal protein S18-alanine N-acetyltransferase [Rhodococcus maanshanensis]SEK86939.1 ribosomal-protein-alanine N-acetyltransferase [Rhodococcus maanshanensis]
MTARIVGMTAADATRCEELETVLFPGDSPWSAEAFRSELTGPHNRYFVARDESDVMLGYAGIALLGRGADAESEVHTIGVDPAHQRRGLGAQLLAALLREADGHGGPVFLEVRTDNEPAIALYRGTGFEIVGTRRNYYQPSGADAYTMRRPAARVEGQLS